MEYNDGCQWFGTEDEGDTWDAIEGQFTYSPTLFEINRGEYGFFGVFTLDNITPFKAKAVRITFDMYYGNYLGTHLGIDVRDEGQC